jgi:protein SCO1/2
MSAHRSRSSRRLALAAIAIALAAGAAAAILASGGSSPSGDGSAMPSVGSLRPYGIVTDMPLTSRLLAQPLTNQYGRTVRLSDLRGRAVLLVPFLSLCTDICPMTTGNLLEVYRSLVADHAESKVEIVELTVDPGRDTPARLAAYARLTGARWQLLTEQPGELVALARFLGFTYERAPADTPPAIDWWTGKPLTYDVNHSDDYYVVDGAGAERVVDQAAPSFSGRLNAKLYRFLSEEGRRHLAEPQHPAWTPADVLNALGAVLHRTLPLAEAGA